MDEAHSQARIPLQVIIILLCISSVIYLTGTLQYDF